MFIVSNESLTDTYIENIENSKDDSSSVGIYVVLGLICLGVLYWYFYVPMDEITMKINGFDIQLNSYNLEIMYNNNSNYIKYISVVDNKDARDLRYRNVSDEKRKNLTVKIISNHFVKDINMFIDIVDPKISGKINVDDIPNNIVDRIGSFLDKYKLLCALFDNDTKSAYDNLVKIYGEIPSFQDVNWKIIRLNGFCVMLNGDKEILNFEDDGKIDLKDLLTSKLSEMCIANCDKILKISGDLGANIKIENSCRVEYGNYEKYYSRDKNELFNTLCKYIQEFVDIVDKDVGILNNDAKAKIDKIKGILSEFQVNEDTSVDKLKIMFNKFRKVCICEVSADAKDIDKFYSLNDNKIKYKINSNEEEVILSSHKYVHISKASNLMDLKKQFYDMLVNIGNVCFSIDSGINLRMELLNKRQLGELDFSRELAKLVEGTICDFAFELFILHALDIVDTKGNKISFEYAIDMMKIFTANKEFKTHKYNKTFSMN